MPYQRRFQKYKVGYIFIVNYSGVPTAYIINRVIPESERKWDENYYAQWYRLYETNTLHERHCYPFTMSEDEMDRHKPCSAEYAEELEAEYLAHVAKNRLLDISNLYD